MLQYRTFSELEKQATLDGQLAKRMKQLDVESTYKKAKQLEQQARAEELNQRLEKAYAFISRCIHVCQLIAEHPDFARFRARVVEGPDFHRMFQRSMDKYEELGSRLRKMYEQQEAENRKPSPILRPPTPVEIRDPIDREDFGNFIKPTELVESVEKFKKSVLLLDYRNKKEPGIAYRNPDAIRALPISNKLVGDGLMFQHFMQYGGTRARTIMYNINEYDLVVLMGDELAGRDPEPFKAGSTSRIMIDALTVTNYLKPLKRRPLLLRGGFPAWQNAYPMYVDGPEEESGFGFGGDDFGRLLGVMKKDTFDFQYPQLSSISFSPSAAIDQHSPLRPTASISPPQSSGSSPPPVIRDIPIRVLPREAAGKTPTNQTNINEEPTITTKEYEAVAPKGRPVVDRSKKPLVEQNRNDKEHTEFPVSFHDAPIPSSRNRQFGHKHNNHQHQQLIPTLGGARPDVAQPANQPATPSQPARPPVPARPPKIPPEDVAKYFDHVEKVFEFTAQHVHANSELSQMANAVPGLRNSGNTCFMNCTLQALFHTPEIKKLFRGKTKSGGRAFTLFLNPGSSRGTRGAIVGSFAALMEAVWSGRYKWIDPYSFLRTFANMVNKEMGDGRQHDTREFLMALLDSMHEDMNKVDDNEQTPFEQNFDGTQMRKQAEEYEASMRRFSASFIADVFYLRTVSKIACGRCQKMSVTFEETPQLMLEIPVDAPAPHLTHCLHKYYGTMPLDGLWKCANCGAHSNALRSTEIWKLPQVMIICLKRFAQKHGELVKNDIEVMIPDVVDMKPFLNPESPEHQQGTRYQRYAVTYHVGQLNGGHYTSKVWDQELGAGWLNFDDYAVSDSSTPPNRYAFILYYSRIEDPGRNY